MRRAVASGLVLALTLVACGAERKAAQSPATASSPPAADDGAAEAATPAAPLFVASGAHFLFRDERLSRGSALGV
ncbi:MAG: hypothetical protein KC657_14035, partial [Myxococcales bacterium]|nr:hypothetical protein [Myxococcales bacterium]